MTAAVLLSLGLMMPVDTVAADTMVVDTVATTSTLTRHAVAAGSVVGTNVLFHLLTRYVANEDYAHISFHSIGDNFKTGFKWDNDKFKTNLFSHPYQGSLYFNCARTTGLNY